MQNVRRVKTALEVAYFLNTYDEGLLKENGRPELNTAAIEPGYG
jgi:hypothetical protein